MEQRLIDANAIKLEKDFFEKVDNVPKFYEWLGKQPTVDAVQVVRCKERKKKFARDEDYKGNILRYICLHGAHEPDFFCSDGERSET